MQLKVETYRAGRAIPDAALVPAEHYLNVPAVDWAEPDGVLMTVEVTSYDRDTTQRDRIDKPRAYAQAGIPVFLLIDRDSREVVVHSKPGMASTATSTRWPSARASPCPSLSG